MGFMTSYKYLDNLCRDINGEGVKGYLSDMEKKPDGAFKVANWQNDYQKLKQYRHIRNMISHETYADESNMCSETDAIWIEGFVNRILSQTDPLTLYRKVTEQAIARAAAYHTANKQNVGRTAKSSNSKHSRSNIAAWIITITITAIFVIAVAIIAAKALFF